MQIVLGIPTMPSPEVERTLRALWLPNTVGTRSHEKRTTLFIYEEGRGSDAMSECPRAIGTRLAWFVWLYTPSV